MSNDEVKISLRAGNVKLKCEGPVAFINDGMLDTAKQALKMLDEFGVLQVASKEMVEALPELSTSAIAAKVGCKSGSELILCALAKLQLGDGKAKATMREIRDEIREGGPFFKASYSANLHKYFPALVKSGRIVQHSKNVFVLSPEEEARFRSSLGVS